MSMKIQPTNNIPYEIVSKYTTVRDDTKQLHSFVKINGKRTIHEVEYITYNAKGMQEDNITKNLNKK